MKPVASDYSSCDPAEMTPKERLDRVVDLLALASLRLIEEQTAVVPNVKTKEESNSPTVLKADAA